jgi:hypothetical protein
MKAASGNRDDMGPLLCKTLLGQRWNLENTVSKLLVPSMAFLFSENYCPDPETTVRDRMDRI